MAERIKSPFGNGLKRSDSSPPSPVFDLPPMRFIAIASVVCASREIEPKDMAPVAKRRTICAAGSTSSSGTGVRPSSSAELMRNRPRIVSSCSALLVQQLPHRRRRSRRIAAHRMLQQRDRLRRPGLRLATDAIGIFAADIERVAIDRRIAESVPDAAAPISCAISARPTPPMRDGGAVEIARRRNHRRGRSRRKSARRNRTDRSRCPSST